MTTTPEEPGSRGPVSDEDIETMGAPAEPSQGLVDADGTDGGDADGTDGTDGGDADGTDGTDGGDADGTDA